MDPSPFTEKFGNAEANPSKKFSRREMFKFLGMVAASKVGEKALGHAWRSYVEPDLRPAEGMGELEFQKVKDFDRELIHEAKERVKEFAGEDLITRTETVIPSVIEDIKTGIEKVLPTVVTRYRQSQMDSRVDLGERVMAGGFLGAITVPLTEKLIEKTAKEGEIIEPLTGSRRRFLSSIAGSVGAAFGAGTVGIDRLHAAQAFKAEHYKTTVEEKSARASLLLADRMVAEDPDREPAPEDESRAIEYEVVLRLAINPNNHFSDPKVLPTAMERFGAAYYLKSFLFEK